MEKKSLSEEHKAKLKLVMVGKNKGKKHLNRKHKPMSEEHRLKLSLAHIGKNKKHIADLTSSNPTIERNRLKLELDAWRIKVFQRDNYTCQICFDYGVILHADHIKPFADYPELRLDLNNGRALCRPCHYYVTFKKKIPAGSKWALKVKSIY